MITAIPPTIPSAATPVPVPGVPPIHLFVLSFRATICAVTFTQEIENAGDAKALQLHNEKVQWRAELALRELNRLFAYLCEDSVLHPRDIRDPDEESCALLKCRVILERILSDY